MSGADPLQPVRTPRRRRHGLTVTLAVAAVAVGLLAPGMARAFTWGLPPSTLSTVATNAQGAQVAVAPDGTTTVVWSQTDPRDPSFLVIMAATRLPGQTGFGAPQRISGPAFGSHVEPSIAVGPDATSVVAWKEGGNDEIFATSRAAGQTNFPDDAPQLVYPASGVSAGRPFVAAAADGSFTMVWVAGATVMTATRLAGEAGFSGSPVQLGTGDSVESPQLAAAPDGSIVAVWTRVNSGVGVTETRTRAAGQREFGSPATLSSLAATGDARDPDVAAGADGQVTVVWSSTWGGGPVWSATRTTASSAFGAPVSVPATSGTSPQVVVAPNGDTTVVWNENLTTIRSSTRAPGGSAWGPAEVVASSTNPATRRVDDARVAVAQDGRVTVVWIDNAQDFLTTSIFSATRTDGAAAWSSATQLDPASGHWSPLPTPAPMIAVAPDGSATAVWRSVANPALSASAPNNMVIKTASTDATSYTVTAATTGTGSGTVTSSPTGIDCGATCTASFRLSTPLVLTAQPAAGASFAGWGGACSGTSSTCTVSVLGDRSVTATFTLNPASPRQPAAHRPLRVKASTSPNGTAVTSGTVPDGATRVVQTVAPIGARRAKARTVRCAITKADGVRTFRCRVTLAAGRWRLTTNAMAGSVVVAQSVRKVTVRARKPAPATGSKGTASRHHPLAVPVAGPSAPLMVRLPASTR